MKAKQAAVLGFIIGAFLAVPIVGCGTPTPKCNAANCTGCCTLAGTCVGGADDMECGKGGMTCSACSGGTPSCVANVCKAGAGGGAGGGGGGGGSAGGAGGGSAGGAGGGTTLTCAQTCAGCCDVNGACQGGATLANCGVAGAACATCTGSAACTAGVCKDASCALCTKNGACQTAQNNTTCGKGGIACLDCAASGGATCDTNAGVCTGGACATGCRNAAGACVPGNTNGACGTSGTCVACTGNNVCTNGACVPSGAGGGGGGGGGSGGGAGGAGGGAGGGTPITCGAAAAADHLLLSEVRSQFSGVEAIEIYNPTSATVDLTDYRIYNASFVSSDGLSDCRYYNRSPRPDGGACGEGPFGDFDIQFPAGTNIGPGQIRVIALNGANGFCDAGQCALGLPDFEIPPSDGGGSAVADMLGIWDLFPLGNSYLTNASEDVILYKWNGSAGSNVQDVDYFIYGAGVRSDKTGVGTYLPDTAIGLQQTMDAGTGPTTSYIRGCYNETNETKSGGNGVTGHNETSEPHGTNWFVGTPNIGIKTPGSVP